MAKSEILFEFEIVMRLRRKINIPPHVDWHLAFIELNSMAYRLNIPQSTVLCTRPRTSSSSREFLS